MTQTQPQKLLSLGVCLGASTVSAVQVIADRNRTAGPQHPEVPPQIVDHALLPHGGNPKKAILSILEKLDLDSYDRIAATGRKFRNFVEITSIPEPEATEHAYRFCKPPDIKCPAIVSVGGETFMVYMLDGSGQISNVITGNKCASGTGEFFLQQLRRMNVSLEEAASWTTTEDPYAVSGRCSVFCKSDCTHATNKGIPKSKVTAGLCRMMADKVLELLKKVERHHIMIVGGTTRNRMMIEYLTQQLPGLIVPAQAPYFEALGAALWALDHPTRPLPETARLFKTDVSSFEKLPALHEFEKAVTFKTINKTRPHPGDVCILGLDVGSTTTKAVLMRSRDDAMLASVYLRTNGDPVGASRRCYEAILGEVEENVSAEEISIEGLGVCGSGRQIAGLHALTEGVINEIIAHATAAVFFDPSVDTIFEIGGQDAKYTYLTGGVPSDYAMNEACSAGTGSFLEESAYETLGVHMEQIADIALSGDQPPNFNDQCAAFIASDIKNAIHEGVQHQDIVAGLVYSICMNYTNRVKGNRPVGTKVFMQGGVCYNRAVPLAMAALVGKPIIVPPEPGLMGAYGVALEIKNRIAGGLMARQSFDLQTLARRTVTYGKTFTCKGGKEKCDRRCSIAVLDLEGRKFPFGGACNRYYNLRHKVHYDIGSLENVRTRQRLIYQDFGATGIDTGRVQRRGSVGFNRSFLLHTYFPLYSNFFAELGFEPVIPRTYNRKGIDQRNAAFCYPAELSHGFFYSLLKMDPPPEFIFLPHFMSIPSLNEGTNSLVCPLVQGETFFLQTTFRKLLGSLQAAGTRVLDPPIDMTTGLDGAEKSLVAAARKMGIGSREARRAFQKAKQVQQECTLEMRRIGAQVLADLTGNPEQIGVVLFGRSYNAFADEAHMGIPHKFASRGIPILPVDFLPLGEDRTKRHMYWGQGQLILKQSRFVARNPQLFGAFITNFSCGPDSFILGYFRDIMGSKPSLTLELDSHTADAGLETRIEAFLDIASAYRKLKTGRRPGATRQTFTPARTLLENETTKVISSSGETLAMTDPRVTLLFPSMGPITTELIAAVFQGKGFHVKAHPPASETELKAGRAGTSCKECLPLILTSGTLLNYIRTEKKENEVLVYFMAGGSGPCRFGQYAIFMEDLVRRLEIPDVALLSLSSENAYAGLGNDFQRRGWWAVIIADVLEDIRSMLLANAADGNGAIEIFEQELDQIRSVVMQGEYEQLERQLQRTAERFGKVPLKQPPESIPTIFMAGEIFVRRDPLSRQYLTEWLARQGFATVCSPVSEWMLYTDFLVQSGRADCRPSFSDKIRYKIKNRFKNRYEQRIKSVLSKSGLVHAEQIDINEIIRNGSHYLSPNLGGEAILTIGSSLTEVVSRACGVIAIGPFGCMPNRLSESILSETMNRKDKIAIEPDNEDLRIILTDIEELPFLAIESDGSPFPQIINAKLEAFCLQARRLHERLYRVN